MAVEKNRVSTAARNKTKTYGTSGNTMTTHITKGQGMYTFVYGKGANRVSETKHCSEAQAEAYKEQLEKAGY
jgi:hypothetical protein